MADDLDPSTLSDEELRKAYEAQSAPPTDPDPSSMSDDDLKKAYFAGQPSPGVGEGVARATAQGMVGDKLFSSEAAGRNEAFAAAHPLPSLGGGMLGRAADIMLPLLGGRYAGGMLGRRLIPEVNASRVGERAFRQGFNRAQASGAPDAIANSIGEEARATALGMASKSNQSSRRLQGGLKFGGGVAGGAAGGAFGASTHGEDPSTGALYGGAAGLYPSAAPLVGGAAHMMGKDWPFVFKLLSGEEILRRMHGGQSFRTDENVMPDYKNVNP